MSVRGGVVFSHASSMVYRDLVCESLDPLGHLRTVISAHPGIHGVIVTDDGTGWKTSDGRTPEQVLADWDRNGYAGDEPALNEGSN